MIQKLLNKYVRLVSNLALVFPLTILQPAVSQNNPGTGYSVYIFADIEGCSGLTNRDQILGQEGSLRMTEDMNACIAACFDAGATRVIARDGHGGGRNVDPELIDKRGKLVHGATPDIGA